MNRTRFVSSTAITAAALALAGPAIAKPFGGQAGAYTLTILPNPLGGTYAQGSSLTNSGLVGGFATLSGNTTMHAMLWSKGASQDLGTLGGPNGAIAWPNRNESGEAAGIAETAQANPLGETWSCAAAVFYIAPPTGDICLGFRERKGTMSALPTFGGYDGFATGINNRGTIVGWAETTTQDSTCNAPQVLQFEAAQWNPKNNSIEELPPYASDPDGAATAINSAGQAVGISGLCGNAVGGASAEHMLLWQNGTATSLPTLGGQYWNTPMDINDQGDVTGFSDHPGDSVASPNFTTFLWTRNGGTQDLGALPGDNISEGLGLNNRDQVVGVSFPSSHGFIWQNGTMTDLNSLLPPGSGYTVIDAQEISDEGTITGEAQDSSGAIYAFVATPSH